MSHTPKADYKGAVAYISEHPLKKDKYHVDPKAHHRYEGAANDNPKTIKDEEQKDPVKSGTPWTYNPKDKDNEHPDNTYVGYKRWEKAGSGDKPAEKGHVSDNVVYLDPRLILEERRQIDSGRGFTPVELKTNRVKYVGDPKAYGKATASAVYVAANDDHAPKEGHSGKSDDSHGGNEGNGHADGHDAPKSNGAHDYHGGVRKDISNVVQFTRRVRRGTAAI